MVLARVSETEEGHNGRERLEKNLPPLKGEVARRAGGVRRPSPAKGESPGFLRIQAAFPLPAEAFQGKAGTPQSRLRRASSPCRGALERAYFRQLTPATPLIRLACGEPPSIYYGIAATGSYRRLDSLRDAPPLRRSPFPVGEGWGKSFPYGGAGRALALTEEGRSGRKRLEKGSQRGC